MDINKKIPAVPSGRKAVQNQSTIFPLFLSEISSHVIRCFSVVFIISLFVATGTGHAKDPLPNDGNNQKHLRVIISQLSSYLYKRSDGNRFSSSTALRKLQAEAVVNDSVDGGVFRQRKA